MRNRIVTANSLSNLVSGKQPRDSHSHRPQKIMNTLPALYSASPVSIDLMRAWERWEDKPRDWSPERVAAAISSYVKFLRLIEQYPNQPHAPTADIDKMWHLHMLSPRAYYTDCMKLFGEILDHDGGFGRGEDEEPELRRTFESTSALWQQIYGEPYVTSRRANGLTNCWHDCQGRCWHACSSKKIVPQMGANVAA